MKTTLMTSATVMAVLLGAGNAMAQDSGLDAIDSNSVKAQNAYQYEFNRDEQCQGYYWGVKRLGIESPCAKKEEKAEEVTQIEPAAQAELLNEYVVYFDFDESHIRQQDMDVLRKAAMDIQQYDPSQVAVVGFTDTRGSSDYNERLSARRAESVSEALTEMGVENYVVDKAARGENDLAVQTPDGVKMQENRRVAIQFLR